MPSLSMYPLHPPKDFSEFESMVVDYARITYGAITNKYGRKGQKQYGVDIVIETIPRSKAIEYLTKIKEWK